MAITLDDSGAWFMHMDEERAFHIGSRKAVAAQMVGISVPSPRTEVDPTSGFSAASGNRKRVGDLIIDNNMISLVLIPLGGEAQFDRDRSQSGGKRNAASLHPLGFRSWRLVIGDGDDHRVLSERTVEAER